MLIHLIFPVVLAWCEKKDQSSWGWRSESEGGCSTPHRPILYPSLSSSPSRDGLHEPWQPWRSHVLTNNDQESLSASLSRLTQGLVGPAGNVWVLRGPSPRKRVAPLSLPTSWETPMPLVSPPVLSCRIHVSSPSSESHTVHHTFSSGFCRDLQIFSN